MAGCTARPQRRRPRTGRAIPGSGLARRADRQFVVAKPIELVHAVIQPIGQEYIVFAVYINAVGIFQYVISNGL